MDPAVERPTVEVADNPARSRYEASIAGELVGVAKYRFEGDVITFFHTKVFEGHEGLGVASALARTALDRCREQGRPVIAECPFFASYIESHPQYQDLLA